MLILSGVFLLFLQQSAISMAGIDLIVIGAFIGTVDILSRIWLLWIATYGTHRTEL